MEVRKLTELLRATIDPSQRQQAEEQLQQISRMIGFAPTLLEVVVQPDIELPNRQAGVIYLKNLITSNWAEREPSDDQTNNFVLHQQDKDMIRDRIIDAVVRAPDIVRVQLAVCVCHIVKNDFPERWPQIVEKIHLYLQNPDPTMWPGALLSLYQLVKNYEYKKSSERGPLNEAMNLLLPILYQLCVQLLNDQSEQSVLLQKQILKIFFALTQYTLPLNLLPNDVFAQWMEIARQVADRPVPEATNTVDEDDRVDLPWWKCKKWAMHILQRVFERYGSPGGVSKEYKEFAEWFLKTFSAGILEVLLKILDQYRRKVYISPRVLQQTLNYINQAVKHAYSWKFLKPHMMAVVQDVLFPIMCHSDADQELWETDPYEYIRVKYDIFEDFISPVTAAQSLLHTACKKRKNMLSKTMEFIMQVLNFPHADPKQKDGALLMVGTVADILLKKEQYKELLETFLCQYVFPEFSSPLGHLRARACWVLHYFSEIKFKNEQVLGDALRLTTNALLTDNELPVKVEAAIALQMFLNSQDAATKYIEPQIRELTLELLNCIRKTENEDLTSVLQKIVCTFSEQLTPIAVEMCQHLAATFSQVLEVDESSDEKAIMAMGLLNTIETILSVMEEQPEITAQLQPTVLQVVGHIFMNSIIDFYEEALSLVCDLTSKQISPDMWKVLEILYQVFQKDGLNYFTDMMPALHNYVTVDTQGFLSNQHYVLAMYEMCKVILTQIKDNDPTYKPLTMPYARDNSDDVSYLDQVLAGDTGEDPECHAAKLLEVIILQCKGQIDQCIPSFVQLVVERLARGVKTSELRTMCLQVVIAALYYNPQLLLKTMEELQTQMSSTESLISHFVKQWIVDTDCFLGLHDRKLCVLGLCTLLSMGPQRPGVLNECAQQIMPSIILLFDGLKRAYAAKAQEGEEEEEEQEGSDIDEEELSSDEDDIDETNVEYLEQLEEKVNKANSSLRMPFAVTAQLQSVGSDDDDDDDDEDYDANEETALESYTTPLDEVNCPVDEYVVFKEVMQTLQAGEPALYEAMTAHLTEEQKKGLNDVFVLADQRKASAESKRIELGGGYVFNQQTVPTSFKFGGTPLGQ